jgi:hypothetical protein
MELKSILGHDDHEIELHYWGERDHPETVTVKCMTCGIDLVELHEAGGGDVVVGPVDEFTIDKKEQDMKTGHVPENPTLYDVKRVGPINLVANCVASGGHLEGCIDGDGNSTTLTIRGDGGQFDGKEITVTGAFEIEEFMEFIHLLQKTWIPRTSTHKDHLACPHYPNCEDGGCFDGDYDDLVGHKG